VREGFFGVLVTLMLEEVRFSTTRGTIYGMAAGPTGGQLLLGLHGWSQRNGWHTWQPLMAPLAEAGCRVISIDMPGWGQSDSWGSRQLGVAEAQAVVLAVLDGARATQAVLMGKSWGGGIAIATALAHPERVGRLVLTAPAFRELARLSQLRQPVLLAWAEDDAVIPYQTAELYVATVPDVELVTYPTGGHSAGPKNAEDFAARVIAFLGLTSPVVDDNGEN
jgi:pimeloyl-ACP methyl ester carboxylesterase